MKFGLFNFFKKDSDDDDDRLAAAEQAAADEEVGVEEELAETAMPSVAEEAEEAAPAPASSYDEIASILGDEAESATGSFLDFAEEEAEVESAAPPPADTIFVPGNRILPHLPQEYLSAPAGQLIQMYQAKPDFVFSFSRSDLMYSLSRGKLEMPIGELTSKIAIDVFRDDIQDYGEQVVQLPLAEVVPLIPTEWMRRDDQDTSKEQLIENMGDYFMDQGTPAPEIPVILEDEAERATPARAPQATREDAIPTQQYLQQPMVPPPAAEEEQVDDVLAEAPAYAEDAEEPAEEDVAEAPVIELSAEQDYAAHESVEPLPAEAAEEELEPVVDGFVAPARSSAVEEETLAEEAPPAPEELDEDFPPVEEPEYDESPAEEVVEPAEPVAPAAPAIAAALPPLRLRPKVPREAAPALPLTEPPREAEPALPLAETPREAATDFEEPGVIAREVFGQRQKSLDMHEKSAMAREGETRRWTSQAPNGININRSGMNELTVLPGVGTHMAKMIVDYRATHGEFTDLHQLRNIVGLGRHTYRGMTGLAPTADLAEAELEVNRELGIDRETVSLTDISRQALTKLNLLGFFITGPDGLVLAKEATNDQVLKLADSMAGIAPKLWSRGRKSLEQGRLPKADMYTFYVGRYAITFAGSEEILCACVHAGAYPNRRDLKALRKVVRELVWYCSYRAVI